MIRAIQALCGAAFAITLMLPAAQAASTDAVAAKQAIAQAAELQAQAMHLDDGWLPTQAALKHARAAFAKHDNAMALAKARHAQMLARISIVQAKTQKRLWRNEVPH